MNPPTLPTLSASPDVPADADLVVVLAALDETDANAPGRPGELLPGPDRRTLLIGVGDTTSTEAVRKAAAAAVRAGRRRQHVAIDLRGISADERAVSAALEAAADAGYQFGSYRSRPQPPPPATVTVVSGAQLSDTAIDRARVLTDGIALARTLVDTPSGDKTPPVLADRIAELARAAGLDAEVWDESRLAAERCGGVLGVGAGSDAPPRIVRLDHRPEGARAHVALCGKGITFDSGGLSLKSVEGMIGMKGDMAGAAAVVGAMTTLGALGIPVAVTGWLAVAENMPSGRATRLQDVLTMRNGLTVEVVNTDAEGRLVLADVLSLAAEQRPAAIIDVATLTWAVMVALGPEVAGVFASDDDLANRVLQSAARQDEPFWRLPLSANYRERIDSPVADLRNRHPHSQEGGAVVAALFLREFAGDVPWAHLDVAGPAFVEDASPDRPAGGTGFAVRTLVDLLETWPA